MASVRPVWVDDGETPQCTKCQTEFGFFNRRHHCRGCGKIFCKLCCNKWIHMPPEYEYDDPQRLCISCFERFSSLDFTTFQDQYGEPGQPTVVLLHGALQTRKSLTFLARHLEHSGYYVLVPDLPGHGTRFRETLTDGSVLDVVKDLIEKKATNKKALVFGYHLGAYIAITFAATYPDLCVGLVVGGAGTDMSQASLGLAVIGLLYKIVSNKTLATLIQENAESFPMSTNILPETMMECVLRPGTYYEPWDNIRVFLCGQDYNKFLQQYPGHVMFLNGSYDVRDAEEKWMKAATHSELRIIEGAGHFMYLDEEFYQTFNRCVTDFADSINWDDPTGPRLDIDTTPVHTEEDDPKNNVELSFVGKPIARNHSSSSEFAYSPSSSSSFISASPSDASSPFLSSSPASSSSSSSAAGFETIS